MPKAKCDSPNQEASQAGIVVTRSDHERLARLAETYVTRSREAADLLLDELERARVVDDGRIGTDVVRMGSTLRFTSDLGEDRQVTLVFPSEADIAEGKISVLAPIAIAMIDVAAGQSIDWTARDDRTHRLTVEKVEAPVSQSPDEPAILRSAS